MITRSTFELIKRALSAAAPINRYEEVVIENWTKPYVVVRCRENGDSFLLDRKYGLITSVRGLAVPEHWVECDLHHQATSFETPAWTKHYTTKEFDSYWLY